MEKRLLTMANRLFWIFLLLIHLLVYLYLYQNRMKSLIIVAPKITKHFFYTDLFYSFFCSQSPSQMIMFPFWILLSSNSILKWNLCKSRLLRIIIIRIIILLRIFHHRRKLTTINGIFVIDFMIVLGTTCFIFMKCSVLYDDK